MLKTPSASLSITSSHCFTRFLKEERRAAMVAEFVGIWTVVGCRLSGFLGVVACAQWWLRAEWQSIDSVGA